MSALDLQSAPAPLHRDASGVIRVAGSRVTLESVLHAYLDGESSEGIVERFPTLELADVHATLAWFLRHRDAATDYLARATDERSERRAPCDARGSTAGLRDRLLARQSGCAGRASSLTRTSTSGLCSRCFAGCPKPMSCAFGMPGVAASRTRRSLPGLRRPDASSSRTTHDARRTDGPTSGVRACGCGARDVGGLDRAGRCAATRDYRRPRADCARQSGRGVARPRRIRTIRSVGVRLDWAVTPNRGPQQPEATWVPTRTRSKRSPWRSSI